VIAVLAMMVLPLPPTLLDVFFTVNIAIALMVMMVAVIVVVTVLHAVDDFLHKFAGSGDSGQFICIQR